MAWMQDDANTVSRILSTSELKYACVKPATCYGHYVPDAPPSFDYRRMKDLHLCNQTCGEGESQNSLFTGYSSFCCRRYSGLSPQLVNDVNVRVVTAWVMSGPVRPIPRHVFTEFAEHRRYSTKCNTIILLYILTNVPLHSHLHIPHVRTVFRERTATHHTTGLAPKPSHWTTSAPAKQQALKMKMDIWWDTLRKRRWTSPRPPPTGTAH
jgi:hypothetical protein